MALKWPIVCWCAVKKLSTHSRHRLQHTQPFNGPLSGTTGWAGTRKVKAIWILLKQETVSGNGISWAVCKSAPRSRQMTTPVPHHSSFLQAGCPSCRPINSVKALKASIAQNSDQIYAVLQNKSDTPFFIFIFNNMKNKLMLIMSYLSTAQSLCFHVWLGTRTFTVCVHGVSKNDTDAALYNFNTHRPTSVIVGRCVAEKVCYRMMTCFPTSPN